MDASGTDERLQKIAERLLQNTKNQYTSWQDTDEDDSFLMQAKDSSVIIDRKNSRAGLYYVLRILNWQGREIESLKSSAASSLDYNAWDDTLAELWERARRSALDVDSVLDSVLNDLEQHPPF